MIGLGPAEAGILLNLLSSMLQLASPVFQNVQGMPPGPRDQVVMQAAAPDSLMYVEWAPRIAPKEGQKGLEGLLSDRENKVFISKVVSLFEKLMADGAGEARSASQRAAMKLVVPLMKAGLTKPGSFSVSFDAKSVAGSEDPKAIARAFKVVALLKADEYADAMTGPIVQLFAAEMGAENVNKKLQRQKFPVPPDAPTIELHREGKYFIFTVGNGVMDDVLARMKTPGKGFDTHKKFQQLSKNVLTGRVASVTYFDIKGVIDSIFTVADKQLEPFKDLVKKTGLRQFQAVVSASTMDDQGQVILRSYCQIDQPWTGLLVLSQGEKLVPGDFAHVPANAQFAGAVSINLKDSYTQIREIMKALDAVLGSSVLNDFDRELKGFESQTGLSFQDDILPALSGKFTIHSSFQDGSFVITDPVLALQIADKSKVEKILSTSAKALLKQVEFWRDKRETMGVLKETKIGKTKVYYWYQDSLAVPVTPCIGMTDQHVLITLHPQAMKSVLRRGGKTKKSMSAAFEKFSGKSTGEFTAYSQGDIKPLLKIGYAALPYLNQLAASQAQAHGYNYTAFDLPSSKALLPYIDPTVSATVRTKDGFYSEQRSPTSMLAAIPIAVGVATIGFVSAQRMPMARPAVGVKVAPKPEPLKKEEFKPFEKDDADEAPPTSFKATPGPHALAG